MSRDEPRRGLPGLWESVEEFALSWEGSELGDGWDVAGETETQRLASVLSPILLTTDTILLFTRLL